MTIPNYPSKRRYMTHEEYSTPPMTYLKLRLLDHGSYPVDFSLSSPVSLASITPKDRAEVEKYYRQARLNPQWAPQHWTPEEICPIYQASPNFAEYVEKCCTDLANAAGNDNENHVDHWLYPGFYIENGHVVGAVVEAILDDSLSFTWPHLFALSICDYKPDHFSNSISKLLELRLLNIDYSNLLIFPPEITKLTNLKTCSIKNSKLTALPDELCHLQQLQYLNLENNQIKSLPAEFGTLTNLRALLLQKNQLTALPESFGTLHSLQGLDLTDNRLASLPVVFSHCRALKWIELECNRFIEFPPQLVPFANKCYIGLRNNFLRSLYGVPSSLYFDFGAKLPQKIYKLIEQKRYDEITAYYARSTIDIATSLVQMEQLTTDETERLLHEATPAIRQYLEQHLPPTHPILAALAERWAIELEKNPDRYHILL